MTEHTHRQPPRLKDLLPEVPVPQGFELGLWLRRALQELPTAPVPQTFEQDLWIRIRRERRQAILRRSLGVLAVALGLLGGGLGLWHLLTPTPPSQAPLQSVSTIAPLTVPEVKAVSSRVLSTSSPKLRHSPTPLRGAETPLPPPED
ncbi:MAG: hypothetical protein NZ960_04170 [Candidatus Kapabacteria bacterium]|nr:hypothetical protein [Candidatus Kapabacteria bacterium]MDW8012150.1 hypothetical protein [Bacteroidota bacterium]